MTQKLWDDVDEYIEKVIVNEDSALTDAIRDSRNSGLPEINVTAPQGKMLHILAKSVAAKKILEMGTLGAYSTIWLARSLPEDGKLISLELQEKHARVATKNLERAGLSSKVNIILGPALESLAKLQEGNEGPFDFIFIDADKGNYPDYFRHALKLSHSGTLIVIDNVVRNGTIIDTTNRDQNADGVVRMYELFKELKGFTATTIQTVGKKGYDGFSLVLVL